MVLISFVLSNKINSQSFLNGSFEINTVVGDQINMTNPAFNAAMANTFAFGSYGDMDIITSSTWGGGGAQNGAWYVALTGGGTDAFSMKLAAPLVSGTTYTISFYDRADGGFASTNIQIGQSTVNNAFGTLIYTAPTAPVVNVWTLRQFSFVAPNNGQFITVSSLGALGNWNQVDNFQFVNVLPIELLYFKTTCKEKGALFFEWETATETGNSYFTVEGSEDALNWNSLTKVNGAGYSDYNLKYNRSINANSNYHYFRLKQTDFNGQSVYSEINYIKCNTGSQQINIYPNPSNDLVMIDFIESQNDVNIKLINLTGQTVIEKTGLGGDKLFIDVSEQAIGIYFIEVNSAGIISRIKLLRSK